MAAAATLPATTTTAHPSLAAQEQDYNAQAARLFEDIAKTQAEVAELLGNSRDPELQQATGDAARELGALSDLFAEELTKMSAQLARLAPLSPSSGAAPSEAAASAGGSGKAEEEAEEGEGNGAAAAAIDAELDAELDALDKQITAARAEMAELVAAKGGGGEGEKGDEGEEA